MVWCVRWCKKPSVPRESRLMPGSIRIDIVLGGFINKSKGRKAFLSCGSPKKILGALSNMLRIYIHLLDTLVRLPRECVFEAR